MCPKTEPVSDEEIGKDLVPHVDAHTVIDKFRKSDRSAVVAQIAEKPRQGVHRRGRAGYPRDVDEGSNLGDKERGSSRDH